MTERGRDSCNVQPFCTGQDLIPIEIPWPTFADRRMGTIINHFRRPLIGASLKIVDADPVAAASHTRRVDAKLVELADRRQANIIIRKR